MAGRHETGFTLIELLVVLTIIALMMAVVPAIFAGLPSIRLRTAADDMVATLRDLHQQAIRRGETTELIFDSPARAYRVSTDPVPRRLPEIVAELGFKPAALVPSSGNEDPVFCRRQCHRRHGFVQERRASGCDQSRLADRSDPAR